MRPQVNRVGSAVFLGVLGLAVALVAMPRGDYRIRGGHTPATGSGSPSAAGSAAASAAAAPSAFPSAVGEGDDRGQASEETDGVEVAAAGSAAPSLAGAPKTVTFGVVLVTFAGAQGAPRTARTKADAEKLAASLAELAKKDFPAAVKKGDEGSTEDAGKMYQGILEAGPEFALFTLEPEHVAGPVETPRGFWIVRRIK